MAARIPVMTERQRLILSISVIAVGSVGLGTFWGFGLKEQHALAVETDTARTSLEQARRTLSGLEDLQRRHRDGAEKAAKLSLLLPDGSSLDRAYEILQEAERQAGKAGEGVEFTILGGKLVEDRNKGKKPAAAVAAQPFEEVLLELTAAGTWAGFVSFLDGVEHADRLIAVKSFKTLDPEKSNPMIYEYRILIGVYNLKPQAAPGAKK